jgi:hypothetical protein
MYGRTCVQAVVKGTHFLFFKTRKIEPELLDHAAPDAARANLRDLVQINRHFGGHSVLRRLLAQIEVPTQGFSLLDVGAASGDSARLVQSLYPQASVVSLDLNALNLSGAPEPKLIGDAFRLPVRTGSVDFVLSSLFLHHFTDDQVVSLLREFNRVARRAVLIGDLERRLLPYLFMACSRVLCGWGRITVHDGKISVRAAFRKHELEGLAQKAGLDRVRVDVHRPAFRLSLSAQKEMEKAAGE